MEASRLSDNSTSVLIRIHVDAPYGDLVRTSTKFWNTGGFSFNVSLFGGAQFKDTSLESLVTGGVAFATPVAAWCVSLETQTPLNYLFRFGSPAAPSNAQFTLASEADKEWLKWSPKIPMTSPDTAADSQPKDRILKEIIKP